MLSLILVAGLTCTTIQDTVTCTVLDGTELRALEHQQLVSSFTRICVSKIPTLQRSQYPGGFTALRRDCEAYAKLEAQELVKAMRIVDQNGVQLR